MQSRYDRRRFLCNAIMTLGATELSIEEKQAYDQLVFSYKHVGYAVIMGSRPQTLMGTADSPIGLATMFVDHDQPSLALISRSFAGKSEGLTRDDVLDNITLCWFTNTAIPGTGFIGKTNMPS